MFACGHSYPLAPAPTLFAPLSSPHGLSCGSVPLAKRGSEVDGLPLCEWEMFSFALLVVVLVLQVNCDAGKWSSANALGVPCSSLCDAGYVCAAGSTSSNPQTCGGAQFYCPAGSAAPTPVQAGYFSTGGASVAVQTAQQLCPSPQDAASNYTAVYCSGDGYIRSCPGGSYGNSSGLTSSSCSGQCRAGFYCPPGSVNASAVPCGGTNVYVGVTSCCQLGGKVGRGMRWRARCDHAISF